MEAYLKEAHSSRHSDIAPYKEDMAASRTALCTIGRSGVCAEAALAEKRKRLVEEIARDVRLTDTARALYAYVSTRAGLKEVVDIPSKEITAALRTSYPTIKKCCRSLLPIGAMRAYVRRDCIAVGVRDLKFGTMRFYVPLEPIPEERRGGGYLYVL